MPSVNGNSGAFQVGRLVACGCWQVREFGLEDGVILVKQY